MEKSLDSVIITTRISECGAELNMLDSKQMQNEPLEEFWSNISRIYANIENIRVSSNNITDFSHELRSCINKKDTEIVYGPGELPGADIDLTLPKQIITNIKKEINNILSYYSIIYQHLENKKNVTKNASISAKLLLGQLEYPDHLLYRELYSISLVCDEFAQDATNIKINPTKKSIKAAFGIDIKIATAQLKTYLERVKSNY